VIRGRRGHGGCLAQQNLFLLEKRQVLLGLGHEIQPRLLVLAHRSGRSEQLIGSRRMMIVSDGRWIQDRVDVQRRASLIAGERRGSARRLADAARRRAARVKSMKGQIRLQSLQIQGCRGRVSRRQERCSLQRGEQSTLEPQRDALKRQSRQFGAGRRETRDVDIA